MKESFKKIGALFVLFWAALGAVCGVGYLWAYNYKVEGADGVTVPAMIGVVILAGLAWPQAVKLWNVLNDACKL